MDPGGAMDTKFMVLRREFEPEIFTLTPDQTSSLAEELWGEDIQFFERFSDAKEAALLLINRYVESEAQDGRKFSFKTSSRARILKKKLFKLTEDEIGSFRS